ncbi:LacI family DNA-binding transcriptional regulator [Lentilactobacillus laojiaonis]|uniref:LacI family DNA-binding transcriptional regulator n=1 Tax=Lentilactobacillus laojiaonis TaxID=2883998 RepID=UPI003221863C
MNDKKVSNMKDVALLAGVSVATVSRYLNGSLDRMSKATALKVSDAINKLNYVPNSIARQMKTKSSKFIAVIVTNIDDYYSSGLFKGISSILESRGYVGVLFDADSDIEREKRLLNLIGMQMFDGVIIQTMNDATVIQNELHKSIPIVIVDKALDNIAWPQVITDNFNESKKATEYFINKGYQHIVVLSSEINMARSRQDRYKGILAAAGESNVDLIEVSEASYNHNSVRDKLESELKLSDNNLIFFLKERWLLEFFPNLVSRGYLNDKKITATSFADTPLAKNLEPKLKLIYQNPYLMGASSAELILSLINNEQIKDNKIIVPAKFE